MKNLDFRRLFGTVILFSVGLISDSAQAVRCACTATISHEESTNDQELTGRPVTRTVSSPLHISYISDDSAPYLRTTFDIPGSCDNHRAVRIYLYSRSRNFWPSVSFYGGVWSGMQVQATYSFAPVDRDSAGVRISCEPTGSSASAATSSPDTQVASDLRPHVERGAPDLGGGEGRVHREVTF